uniref:Uncharacterized protein n=1 Tax=Panagrolaimus superbus TaxID=310955 RepID=A0A914YWV1_9BILA
MQNFDTCDGKCEMIKSISDVSHDPQIQALASKGGDMVKVLGTIGPICTAAECYLPCFRDQMNMVCPRAGGMFVDALLKPFHFLAAYIEESGSLVKTFVANKMPQSCKYLINEDTLTKIRKGDYE